MSTQDKLDLVRDNISFTKEKARSSKEMAEKFDQSFWKDWSYWMRVLKELRKMERLYLAKVQHEQEMEKLWESKT